MSFTSLEEYQAVMPNTEVDGMKFYLPNTQVAWRVETMYSKEPDTVAWIRSMPANAVFYDIGANVGIYTMLAWKQGLRVYAFEPESQNFACLSRTIALNGIGKDRVVAYPLCISDGFELDTLRLSMMTAGGSCHSFASDLNYKRESKQWACEQGSISVPMDDLVAIFGLPSPDYIKVDVDGFEDKVLRGATQVLANTSSILVEMDSANAQHMEWKDELERRGFFTDERQILAARRKEGPFSGIGNVIFTRPKATAVEEAPASPGERTDDVPA